MLDLLSRMNGKDKQQVNKEANKWTTSVSVQSLISYIGAQSDLTQVTTLNRKI